MSVFRCTLTGLVASGAFALVLPQHSQAATRLFRNTTVNGEMNQTSASPLTWSSTGSNSSVTKPGSGDTALFQIGQANSIRGFDATTTPTVTGTFTPGVMTFDIATDVTISGAGSIAIKHSTSHTVLNAGSGTNQGNVTFSNSDLTVGAPATAGRGLAIYTHGGSININTTTFQLTNSDGARDTDIQAYGDATGGIVITPQLDLSGLSFANTYNISSAGTTSAGSVRLDGGIKGHASLATDFIINQESASGPLYSGTTTIGGTSNFIGTTSVKAGKLLLNGNFNGSGAISVDAGAALGGGGIVSSSVILAGMIAPGNSAGTLTVGGLAISDGSSLSFELNPSDQTVGSNINDLINVQGLLDLAGVANPATVTLNVSDVTNAGLFGGIGTWTLATYSSINPAFAGTLPVTIAGLAGNITSASVNVNGNGTVTLTTVPEPTAMLMVLIGTFGLAVVHRNRRTFVRNRA